MKYNFFFEKNKGKIKIFLSLKPFIYKPLSEGGEKRLKIFLFAFSVFCLFRPFS